ncbi:odorant receptor 42a-like [Drosophila sulfurigaster albostrigata]|uniref:odorant receptor 42a-like n=1 Tax=Drosophila sulfurigaster albostrigata TaxID=89887 RepID=UPI002D21B126|nr:odorant receptor 42a-like [Drosophila sulfurigaster albostrigata]
MVVRKYFPSMYTEKDSAPAKSRNATLYLLRCVFLMGIRTPPQRFFVVYCLWSFALNLCSTFYQPIGFMTGYISHLSEFTPGEFLTSLQVAFNAWSCSTKVVIVWILVKRFDVATEILDEMDKMLTKSSERRNVHRAVALSNRIFFFFMTVYIGYATSTFISAIFMGRPPYQNYYPWLDWRASKWQYWLQTGLEYFAMLGACFQDVCVDCYPINFVLPLRAHMANFAQRLRNLGNDPDESADKRYAKLVKCIKDHKVILRFCDTLRPMIGGTIFVQLLVVGLVMGFTLINIVKFADFGSRVAALSFMSAVLLETTPFCTLCNYLTDDSLKLADALFESNWIDQEKRYKTTLTHFLHNLQKPIVFMAGNVFTISVATNLTASKFSFSVFTLVQNMDIAEKLGKLSKPHEN